MRVLSSAVAGFQPVGVTFVFGASIGSYSPGERHGSQRVQPGADRCLCASRPRHDRYSSRRRSRPRRSQRSRRENSHRAGGCHLAEGVRSIERSQPRASRDRSTAVRRVPRHRFPGIECADRRRSARQSFRLFPDRQRRGSSAVRDGRSSCHVRTRSTVASLDHHATVRGVHARSGVSADSRCHKPALSVGARRIQPPATGRYQRARTDFRVPGHVRRGYLSAGDRARSMGYAAHRRDSRAVLCTRHAREDASRAAADARRFRRTRPEGD